MDDTGKRGNTVRRREDRESREAPCGEAERRGLYGQRASASHDEVVRREFARIAAMTARERMIEALSLSGEMEETGPRSKSDGGQGGDRQ